MALSTTAAKLRVFQVVGTAIVVAGVLLYVCKRLVSNDDDDSPTPPPPDGGTSTAHTSRHPHSRPAHVLKAADVSQRGVPPSERPQEAYYTYSPGVSMQHGQAAALPEQHAKAERAVAAQEEPPGGAHTAKTKRNVIARGPEEQRLVKQRTHEQREAKQWERTADRSKTAQVEAARKREVEMKGVKEVQEAREREQRLQDARARGVSDAKRAIDEVASGADVRSGNRPPPSPRATPAYKEEEYPVYLRNCARVARSGADRQSWNAQASAWIYTRYNEKYDAHMVDLHGLYVEEACYYAELALAEALRLSLATICFIFGQGKHTPDGVPKIKPAIIDLLKRHDITAIPDEINPGRLIARLD